MTDIPTRVCLPPCCQCWRHLSRLIAAELCGQGGDHYLTGPIRSGPTRALMGLPGDSECLL